MDKNIAQHYLENASEEFHNIKRLGDRALKQLNDKDFFITLDVESNNIAIIVKHLAGNMRSRWVDFLTSDGEKSDRNRDQEFILTPSTTHDLVMDWWGQGWGYVFGAIGKLQPEDILKQVVIRNEPHTVMQAINRQIVHYAGHVGQIVFLSKHLKSSAWNSLSIPRGHSEQFNQTMYEKNK